MKWKLFLNTLSSVVVPTICTTRDTSSSLSPSSRNQTPPSRYQTQASVLPCAPAQPQYEMPCGPSSTPYSGSNAVDRSYRPTPSRAAGSVYTSEALNPYCPVPEQCEQYMTSQISGQQYPANYSQNTYNQACGLANSYRSYGYGGRLLKIYIPCNEVVMLVYRVSQAGWYLRCCRKTRHKIIMKFLIYT